jgi:transposase-like protein
MRDVESLCEEARLGRTSKSTIATICAELHERFEAFCRRSLYDVNLVVLFLDAVTPASHREYLRVARQLLGPLRSLCAERGWRRGRDLRG